jgi:hypothetical protein
MLAMTVGFQVWDAYSEKIQKVKEATDDLNQATQETKIKGLSTEHLTRLQAQVIASKKALETEGVDKGLSLVADGIRNIAAFSWMSGDKTVDKSSQAWDASIDAQDQIYRQSGLINERSEKHAQVQTLISNGQEKSARILEQQLKNEERIADIKSTPRSVMTSEQNKKAQEIGLIVNAAETKMLETIIEMQERSLDLKISSTDQQLKINNANYHGNVIAAKEFESQTKRNEAELEYQQMIKSGVNPSQAAQFKSSRIAGIDQDEWNTKVQEEIKREKNPTSYYLEKKAKSKEYDRAQRKVAERSARENKNFQNLNGEEKQDAVNKIIRDWNPVDPKGTPGEQTMESFADRIGTQIEKAIADKSILIFKK